MIFKNPQILWALFAIAIPIIIHLFNFKRYKKVYFSNIAMLKNIELQTKKYSQLKHLLVLLLRIFLIAALVFAFAQPYIPAKNNKKTKSSKAIVSIFVDNSFTMQNETEKSKALEQAILIAENIADSYNKYDDFILITNDLLSKHSHQLSKNDLLSELSQIVYSPLSIGFKEVLNFQNAIMDSNTNIETYMISDFQKSQFELDKLNPSKNNKINLIPIESVEQKNIFIDSVWTDMPFLYKSNSFRLYFRIYNFSDEKVENLSVKLNIDGDIRGLSSVDLNPMSNSISYIDLKFNTAGNKLAYLNFDEYPIDFDNIFYFNLDIYDNISVLEISDELDNSAIEKFYKTDSSFIFKSQILKNIDYSKISDYSFIVLNQINEISGGLRSAMNNFINDGGSLLLIPKINENNIANINELLQTLKIPPITNTDSSQLDINYININSDVFKDVFESNQDINKNIVDFPKLRNYYKQADLYNDKGEKILGLSNSEPFLKSYEIGEGKFHLMLSSLNIEDNNFSQHALIVPTLYNLTIQSKKSNQLYISTNQQTISFVYNKTQAENIFKIINLQSNSSFIPQIKYNFRNVILDFKNNIKQNGFYEVRNSLDSVLFNFSINYPRKESILEFNSFDELKEYTSTNQNIKIFDGNSDTIKSKISQTNTDKDLWIIFILMGLLFILFEVILLRFLK